VTGNISSLQSTTPIFFSSTENQRLDLALQHFQEAKDHGYPLSEEDTNIVKNYLHQCSREELHALLGLDLWATNEPMADIEKVCSLIIEAFLEQKSDLDLCSLMLSSLPPVIFLPIFPFTFFDCSENLIEYLPPTLSLATRLQSLNLWDNNLSVLPPIDQLTELYHLNCSFNLFESLPINLEKCTKLVELDFSFNHLTSIPEELKTLSNLQVLNCSGNNALNIVPFLLLELPNSCEINLSETAISDTRRDELEWLSTTAYGPQFIFFEEFIEDDDIKEKPLSEVLEDFYTVANSDIPPNIEILCTKELSPFPIDNEVNLKQWLIRLSDAKDGKETSLLRTALYQEATDFIALAIESAEYRKLFQTILIDASTTCGDRVALYNIYLHVAKELLNIDKTDLPKLAEFLKRGGLAIQILFEFGQNKILELRALQNKGLHKKHIDEIENYLELLVSLKQPLNLPIGTVEHMLYQSDVTEEDLQQAKKLVLEQLDNEVVVIEYLSKNRDWLSALEKKYPTEMQSIEQKKIENEIDPNPSYIALTKDALGLSTEPSAKKRKTSN